VAGSVERGAYEDVPLQLGERGDAGECRTRAQALLDQLMNLWPTT
jgi:hypothetical protein